MNGLTKGSWEFIFQPVFNTFADNTSYYLWGRQAWSNTVNGYLPFLPTSNMYLEEVTFYSEPGILASTEPSVLSLNERYIYANSAAYSSSIKDHIITKNFTFNYTPHPLGLMREFKGLFVPMVTGRLYVLKMQVPAMATNASGVMSVVLKGSYRAD